MKILFYKRKFSFRLLFPLFLSLFFFPSCQSLEEITENTVLEEEKQNQTITMAFAGDIMAHKPNYSQGKFDQIWSDVKKLLSSSQLNFANLETPVCDELEYSSYPAFCVHHEYADEAIKAGFNVFSLANNHTNDQYLKGIKSTKKYFSEKEGVWACGIKDSPSSPLTFSIIEKNGFKVLFIAITELLNRNDYKKWIDYVKPDEKNRNLFIEEVKKIRAENPSDIFILSIHTAEEEYKASVKDSQRNFYYDILKQTDADIIWANHPHVPREWEEVTMVEDGRKKIIFYGQGNTISGQRWDPQFEKPETPRDWTGDGFISLVCFEKDESGVKIVSCEQHFITTYIRTDWFYTVKLLDEDFISYLGQAGRIKWQKYMKERKKLLEGIQMKSSFLEVKDKTEKSAEEKE